MPRRHSPKLEGVYSQVPPRRPLLIPSLLVLAAACWSLHAFVPAPKGCGPWLSAVSCLAGASEHAPEQVATVAALAAALGALPAEAVDNPLAHGAPGAPRPTGTPGVS